MLNLLEMFEPTIVKIIDSPLNIIVSIMAIISAICTMILSLIFGLSQRRHNRANLRPIVCIKTGNYQNHLFVNLVNMGTGPLYIKSFKCYNGCDVRDSLISMMPNIGRPWDTFWYDSLDNQVIAANDKIRLIELTLDYNDKYTRELIRNALSSVKIEIEYTDAFGTKFDKYVKSLETFTKLNEL